MDTTDHLSLLHVDDDPELGALVKTYLERDASDIDCSVATEQDPEQALERIRSSEIAFDCVISDYNMPQMNGIEFLEAVRESHPELPVLLFSGEEPSDIAAEIIQAGLTDYLHKGLGTDQYTMLIRRVSHAVDSPGEFNPEAETELDGIGVVGADDHFEEADETYAALYGYTPDEIEGKHWTDLHPDTEVEHIRTHVLPVVQRGGEWTGRSKGLRADDSTFTESKMVTAMDDGRLLIAVSEFDDTELIAEE
jgi:PAS domain S-box-containing protein